MKKNRFKMEDDLKQINKEIARAEAKNRRRAVNYLLRKLRAKIKQEGLVDSGNLLKGVKKTEYEHATLAGMAPPAFHAAMLEFGSYKAGTRHTDAGHSRGTLDKHPFFLKTWMENKATVIRMLQEDYI